MASDPSAMAIAEADLFTVPLLDGGVGLGQVVAPDVGGAVLCLISDLRVGTPQAVPDAHVLSMLYTQVRPFQTRTWTIIGYDSLPAIARRRRATPDEAETVQDPGVIEAFFNAIHGLYPWDGFPDPNFFSSLLLPGVPDPSARRLQNQDP